MTPILVNQKQVAKRLGVHRHTVRKLSQQGKLPGTWQDTPYYHWPSVEKALEAGNVKPAKTGKG